MNPEVEQINDTQDIIPQVQEVKVDISPDQPVLLTPYSTTSQSSEQWRRIGERVSAFLAELPDYLTDFFSEYRRPLVTIGLVIAAFISVKLTLAILDSINDIPLLAPTFELIGIAYATWFIYRYLWQASNRKELAENFDALKSRVLGENSTDL
jgi:CAAD domains of cyanobacterial aminoacyl-tRNA synthetase